MTKSLAPKDIRKLIAEKIPKGLVTPEHTETQHFYRYQGDGILYHSTTTKMGDYGKNYLKNWSTKVAADFLRENIHLLGDRDQAERLIEIAQHKHDTVLRIAGEIGSYAHEFFDRFMREWIKTGKKNKDIDLSDFGLTYIQHDDIRYRAIRNSFLKFIDDHFIIPIASELLVANTKVKYAGTFDSLVLMAHLRKEGDGTCGAGSKTSTSETLHEYWLSGDETKQKYTCVKCNQKVVMHLTMLDWKTSNVGDKSEYAMQVASYIEAFRLMTGLKPSRAYIVHFLKDGVDYNLFAIKNLRAALAAYKHLSAVYDWDHGADKKHFTNVYKQKTIIRL